MGEFFIPQRKKDMNLSSFFVNEDIKICINKIRKQHAYLISYKNLSKVQATTVDDNPVGIRWINC